MDNIIPFPRTDDQNLRLANLFERKKFPFERTDSGRSESRHPRATRDCYVRTLSTVCKLSYDEAYAMLRAAGYRVGKSFDFHAFAMTVPLDGRLLSWTAFPAVKGKSRVNVAGFAKRFPSGRFILRIARYYTSCIDGKICDVAMLRGDECVYGAWEVVQVDSSGA
jgi:hypothetical protein